MGVSINKITPMRRFLTMPLHTEGSIMKLVDNFVSEHCDATYSMAYGTRRFNAAFTRALQ